MSIIKRLCARLGIHMHAQNLNEKPGDIYGSPWIHGRVWFRRASDELRHGLALRIEWRHLRKESGRLMLEIDGAHGEATVSWAVPGVSHFVTLANVPRWLFDALPLNYLREERRYAGERSIYLRVHDGAIWWSIWGDDMEHRHDDPRWMQGCWHPLDSFFGRTKHSSRTIEERDVVVPMPEHGYAARVTMTVSTWARPRWPWWPLRTERRCCDVKIPGGIGFPGKGENSWDIGDDGLYGMSTSASTVEEAIGKVVAAALHNRQRYGGSHEFKSVAEHAQAEQDAPAMDS